MTGVQTCALPIYENPVRERNGYPPRTIYFQRNDQGLLDARNRGLLEQLECRHLLPVLRSVVEPAGATVVAGDAMELDWDALLGPAGGDRPWSLVANLPYNIATPLVLDLLAGVPAIERLLVMVQLEVGERLAAGPGTKAYGIPSVKAAWWADAEVVGTVSPSVFLPQPRVASGLVDLRRRQPPGDDATRARVFQLVEAGFGQRRKMLRRSLAALVEPGQLEAAGIRPEARAEELTLEDWLRLAATSPA